MLQTEPNELGAFVSVNRDSDDGLKFILKLFLTPIKRFKGLDIMNTWLVNLFDGIHTQVNLLRNLGQS